MVEERAYVITVRFDSIRLGAIIYPVPPHLTPPTLSTASRNLIGTDSNFIEKSACSVVPAIYQKILPEEGKTRTTTPSQTFTNPVLKSFRADSIVQCMPIINWIDNDNERTRSDDY